jgi:glycosyltransferase involved in cell wall biosynthesis
MNKKKILHIISDSKGGAGKIMEDVLVGISSEFQTSLLVLDNGSWLDIKKLEIHNIRVQLWGVEKHKDILLAVSLFRFIKTNKPDIVHVHLFPTLYLVALCSLFLKNIKFVYTEHAAVNNRHNRKWLRPIEKIIYGRFHFVIAVSNSVGKMLEPWIEHKGIIVVNNGIDMNKTIENSKNNWIRRKYKDKVIVSMVARFDEGKDFETVIDAVSILDNKYQLLLIGDGKNFLKVGDYIIKKEASDKVEMLGYRKDVLDILRQSDLSVLSSAAEGLGLVILESVSLNVPCIGSNVLGIKDVLADTEFLFDYGNYQQLANKINYVFENKDKNKIKMQMESIKKNFDVEKMISGHVNIYNSIL